MRGDSGPIRADRMIRLYGAVTAAAAADLARLALKFAGVVRSFRG